jgi:spore germination protein GerM
MRRALLTAMVALVATSCGVPGNGDVQVVDRSAVPFGLLEEEGAAPGAQEGAAVLDLFLVAGDPGDLVPVQRRVDSPTLQAVLDELAADPTAPEVAVGLRSPIGEGDFLDGVALNGGIATVDLTDDFSSLSGTDQLLAIGQVVLSLTARPGVGRLTFTLDGDPVEVPRGDGSLTSGSVSRDAYVTLLGAAAPPSPAAGPATPGGSVTGMVTGRR